MAKKRRHRTAQGEIEDQLLRNARWKGLKEQDRLIAVKHSKAANNAASRRANEFIHGGINAVDWVELTGQK